MTLAAGNNVGIVSVANYSQSSPGRSRPETLAVASSTPSRALMAVVADLESSQPTTGQLLFFSR